MIAMRIDVWPRALALALLPLACDSATAADDAYRLTVDSQQEYRLKLPDTENKDAGKRPYKREVDDAARCGIEPALIHALIQTESAYDESARSAKGAVGLMQVLPTTGARLGFSDLSKPQQNLAAGVAYLCELKQRFDGDLSLMLAAYNAGEHAVLRYGGIPPYAETRHYVPTVLERMQKLMPAANPYRLRLPLDLSRAVKLRALPEMQ